jgi:hypothetical protein
VDGRTPDEPGSTPRCTFGRGMPKKLNCGSGRSSAGQEAPHYESPLSCHVLCSGHHPTGDTMRRIWCLASRVVVTALLIVVTSVPLRAIGPAILVFYGGDLKPPVLVFPGNPSYNPTNFIWNPVNGGVPYASEKRGTLPPMSDYRMRLAFVSAAVIALPLMTADAQDTSCIQAGWAGHVGCAFAAASGFSPNGGAMTEAIIALSLVRAVTSSAPTLRQYIPTCRWRPSPRYRPSALSYQPPSRFRPSPCRPTCR